MVSNDQTTVSVVIPCHNAAHTIGDAIASAQSQTFENVEVLVVDDCSTDGSARVVSHYGCRVILISTEACLPMGPSHARNVGLRRSSGDFVQFLDADDILMPEKSQRASQSSVPNMKSCSATKFCRRTTGTIVGTSCGAR